MSTQNQYTLSEKDKKFFFHPFTALKAHEQNGSMFIARGKDSTLFDLDGKSYLDAMAGLWCVNIGYGNDEMADARADGEGAPGDDLVETRTRDSTRNGNLDSTRNRTGKQSKKNHRNDEEDDVNLYDDASHEEFDPD